MFILFKMPKVNALHAAFFVPALISLIILSLYFYGAGPPDSSSRILYSFDVDTTITERVNQGVVTRTDISTTNATQYIAIVNPVFGHVHFAVFFIVLFYVIYQIIFLVIRR